MSSPEDFLRAHRLEPLDWDAVLRRIETRLGPVEAAHFTRLHRAFVAYPAEHTCRGFYDFIARHDVHNLLACHRFTRLATLLRRLREDLPSPLHAPEPQAPVRALDYGAGSGILAAWLRDEAGFAVAATDLSPETRARLEAQGFSAPQERDRFALILCADSLGEIHADEDDWLADAKNSDAEDFLDELEARYGFSHKVSKLKDLLTDQGVILLYEPIRTETVWVGAARLLRAAGWHVEPRGEPSAWGLRISRPIR